MLGSCDQVEIKLKLRTYYPGLYETYTKFDLSNCSNFAILANIYSLYLQFVSFSNKPLNEERGGPASAGAGRVPQTTTTATTTAAEAGPTTDPTRAG